MNGARKTTAIEPAATDAHGPDPPPRLTLYNRRAITTTVIPERSDTPASPATERTVAHSASPIHALGRQASPAAVHEKVSTRGGPSERIRSPVRRCQNTSPLVMRPDSLMASHATSARRRNGARRSSSVGLVRSVIRGILASEAGDSVFCSASRWEIPGRSVIDCRGLRDLSRLPLRQMERETEARSRWEACLVPEVSAHGTHEPLGNRQSETHSLGRPRVTLRQLLEVVEDALLVCRGHTGPVVGDHDSEVSAVLPPSMSTWSSPYFRAFSRRFLNTCLSRTGSAKTRIAAGMATSQSTSDS